jgi:hypothetical protein
VKRNAAFRLVAIVLLVVFVAWTAATVVTAIVRGEGHGFVFVSALVLLGALLCAALWLVDRIRRMGR